MNQSEENLLQAASAVEVCGRRQLLRAAAVTVGGGTAAAVAYRAHSRGDTEACETRVMTTGMRYSDLLPDVQCRTQTDRSVRLVTDLIRDRIAIVSFMYTQCNGICPATVGLFQKLRVPLYREFGDRVQLISITLDPLVDSVARLRTYAAAFGAADEAGAQRSRAAWTFLTGDAAGLEQIRRGFGYIDPDPQRDRDRTQHAALFTFGNDATNRWCTFPTGLPLEQALAGVIRICGTSATQRYGSLAVPQG
jgi:protein SCO1/2